MKSAVEEFVEILKDGKEKEIIPFLQALSKEDKKSLAIIIKKIARELNKYYNEPNLSPSGELTKILLLNEKPGAILNKASFVCLSFEEMRRAVEFISLDEVEDSILPWYQPSWLNRYLLEMVEFEIDYEKMIGFMNKGWLVPTKQFIAQNVVYGLKDELKHPISKEHIWHLFEEDTNLYCYDNWIKRFQHYAHQGDINRDKLLKESILTSIRNFNKPQTGWFLKLFNALEPTEKELLSLQDELYLALGSQQSKAVGDALKYLRKIAKNPDFQLNNFIEQIPVLLVWSIKSLITSTLSIIDILIKTNSEQKEEIGLLVVQALAQEDEALQVKTIKLLNKHKLLQNQTILDEIAIYSEGLYSSAKAFLPDMEFIKTLQETIEITPPKRIREDNHIVYPESFDEMVFFFSQVFDGNNVYDFDLFVALLPKVYLQITPENVSKLEPAFLKAFKYYTNPPDYKYTQTGDMMAQGFVYFGYTYIESLNTLYKNLENKYLKKYDGMEFKEEKALWIQNSLTKFQIEPKTASVFNVHYQLILFAFEKIEQHLSYEPLFLTTHSPCWIDADILSKRLKNSPTIHPFELQIALSKTVFNDTNIIQSPDIEINSLLTYLQTKNMPLPLQSIKNPAYWLTPLLRKNNPKDLEVFAQHFQKEKHDIPFSNILEGIITHRNSKNTTFTSHCVQLIRTLSFDSIYNYTRLFTDDLPFVLALVPTMPNFILEARYKTPQTNFEVMMPIIIETWGEYGNSNYLFLARTLTDMSKTTRHFTAELWHQAIQHGTMNHQLLGLTLGKLEHNEYAPLKRFTDLVVSNMLNLSTLHNRGLHTLFSAMIAHMNDEPIKGTKKLLEIYLEVLSLTELEVPSETMEKLEVWGEVKSLKSVVKKIV